MSYLHKQMLINIMIKFITKLLVAIVMFTSISAMAVSDPLKIGNLNQSPIASHLSEEQAFQFDFRQSENSFALSWMIAEGHYLYKPQFKVVGLGVDVHELTLPSGVMHHDEFYGDVEVYSNFVELDGLMNGYTDGALLEVTYQGCKEGFCYPPVTKEIDIDRFHFEIENKKVNQKAEKTSNSYGLGERGWYATLLFFILGIGLAFTPCVFPMYPILSGILMGGSRLNVTRSLFLASVYVQGMAISYSILGLVVASAGLKFQAALQHPYVLFGLSGIFVVLALSMFGVLNLQMPSALQTRLSALSNDQKGGSPFGVFVMGVISGLICSPCTTAPLSGALLFVAQTGDLLTGGVTLYALALGMGLPLVIISVFGTKLMPKAGSWMNEVKTLFGFVLLAMPIYFVSRVVDQSVVYGLSAGLLACVSVWVLHLRRLLPQDSLRRSVTIAVAALGVSASMSLMSEAFIGTEAAKNESIFTVVNTQSELEERLRNAATESKPVVIDFYADWCVACKQFEKYTFADKDVREVLKSYVLLKVDITDLNDESKRIMSEYKILGLPAIDFVGSDGVILSDKRISGFVEAGDFLSHLGGLNR